MKRDLLSLSDFGASGLIDLLDRAEAYERSRGRSDHPHPLQGQSVALLFDKPSTRTRFSLEVATVELGGHPIVLPQSAHPLNFREPLEDIARVLGRMVTAVAYRTNTLSELGALAQFCRVPVVNALTDETHPLQVLADLYTVRKVRGHLDGVKVAWVGDATNVARSWIEAAGLLKLHLVLAAPGGFEPPSQDVARANERGALVELTKHAEEAARGADVLLTDTWVSMGKEAEAEIRRSAFLPFRLTQKLVDVASKDVIVLHCLPAHRGEEIEAEVLEGPRSYVWECVEARLHTAKAALEWVLSGDPMTPESVPPRFRS